MDNNERKITRIKEECKQAQKEAARYKKEVELYSKENTDDKE